MIKKSHELKKDVHQDFRGGKGEVVFYHYMDEQSSNGAGRLFCKTVLPPGSSIGVHKHVGDHETYFIISGKARVNDNGVQVEMGPGDLNHCLDGQEHGIENIGDADLVYVANILYTEQKKG
jgi:mannose-6-phosphate isomerase-like protein (cupin superfamily)